MHWICTVPDNRSLYIRKLILRGLRGGRNGHLGSPFSIVEILLALYDHTIKFDAKNPQWEGRDRVILSKGHGCLALYSILADKGFFPLEELDRFSRKGSILGGLPSPVTPGIEMDGGTLGHGLSIGVGMALAAKIRKQNHRIFVIVGDGEIQEGSIWEAALCAAKHKLDNLTVIVDYNKMQSWSRIDDVQPMEPMVDKWKSFGFACYSCDGHNIVNLTSELSMRYVKPNCIIAHTLKGKGISEAEQNIDYHHRARITDEEMQKWEAQLEQA